jgi:hypothetical protein
VAKVGLDADRDLLGNWSVHIRFGRIGGAGRVLRETTPTTRH